MVVAHGHFSTLAPLLEGPLCLVEEEVGTFSHWLGLHGGESPWLAVSKSGAPHSLAARCLLVSWYGIKKTPPGKLSFKADFLRLLYGSVDGNFNGLGSNFHRSALLTISAIFFAKWSDILD